MTISNSLENWSYHEDSMTHSQANISCTMITGTPPIDVKLDSIYSYYSHSGWCNSDRWLILRI